METPTIPARSAPILFGLILSAPMVFIVSGLSTLCTVGFAEHLLRLRLGNWLIGWAIACPTVLIVATVARRIVARLKR